MVEGQEIGEGHGGIYRGRDSGRSRWLQRRHSLAIRGIMNIIQKFNVQVTRKFPSMYV